MIDSTTYSAFKKGSTTYFYSSIFLPATIKEDVFILYRYVRELDDIVDTLPQDRPKFNKVKSDTYRALEGEKVENDAIMKFVVLSNKYAFERSWIEAFIQSMESDLQKKEYSILKDTEEYMYGSAEVIGLFMSRIMKLPKQAMKYAQLLGKSMQYANFIRDIPEDLSLDRQYLPITEVEMEGLKSLAREEINANKKSFARFIEKQIDHYYEWQNEAEKGFKYIPLRYRIPIQTASDMYKWTMEQIKKNPFIIYQNKVKPNKARIFAQIIKNTANNYAYEP